MSHPGTRFRWYKGLDLGFTRVLGGMVEFDRRYFMQEAGLMTELFVHRVTFDGDAEESRFLDKAKPKRTQRVLVRIGNTGGKDVMAPFIVTDVKDLGDRQVLVLAADEPDEPA